MTPAAYAERKRALAAVERMHVAPAGGDAQARRLGMRPLRPPPVQLEAPTMTAGAAELAREMRRGTYRRPRAHLFGG